MKSPFFTAACLAGLFASVAPRADAQATGSEIPVNTTTADSQSASRIAMDGSGRFVVVWQSLNQDVNPGFGVYMRRFSIAGVPLAGEVLVNTTTTGSQKSPAVSTNDAGNFVVVWEGDDAAGRGIFMQRYSAAGAPLGGEVLVNTTTAGDQKLPAVSMKVSGEFVVVWEGPDADITGVYAQLFNAAGAPIGGEVAMNSSTTAHAQTRPVVAIDSTGQFYAAWESDLWDGGGLGVYARRFENDGTPRDTEFLVNTTTAGDQKLPAIAAALNGDFVVTWQSIQAADGDGGIFAQRYLQNGALQGTEFRVNSTTAGAQHGSAAGMDANGNFVVAWSGPDAGAEGIYGQRYRADGLAMGPEFAANLTTAGQQAEAAVAMNRRNQPLVDSQVFALSWTSPDAALEGITARLGGFGNSVTVLAPDDGRAWSVGSSQRIRFAHTLPAATRDFTIELIVNAGTPQVLQAAYLAGRTVGNYQHTVADPGFPGVFTGVIRVTSTVDPLATDDSAPFPIELPTITVVQPPPDVLQGTPTEIRWTHNLGLQSHVKVELARDGSLFNEVLSADVTNGWVQEGRFTWTPTGTCTPAAACKIQVTWLTDLTVSGVSAPFDIVTLSNIIFVNNAAPGPGSGTFASPYNTLLQAQTASVAGNWIFVYEGNGTTSGYANGITLKAQQKLIGEGEGLVVGGNTIVAAGNPPKLTGTGGDVVTLNVDNEVAGVTLQPPNSFRAVVRAGSLGTAQFRNSTIDLGASGTSGSGIELHTTPSGTLTLDTITMSGVTSGNGIRIDGGNATITGNTGLSLSVEQGRLVEILNATGGGLSLTGGTLTNVNGTGVNLIANTGAISVTLDNMTIGTVGTSAGVSLSGNNAASTFNFGDLDVTTANAAGIVAFNGGIVTVTAGATGSTIDATGGPALEIFGTTPFNGAFASVSSTNSSTSGVNLNATSAPIVFSSPGGAISGSNITGFGLVGGNGAVSYGGSISKTSGAASQVVTVSSRTGGTATFSGNLACSGPCLGVLVVNNSSGSPTITFSGASKTLNTGANAAVGVSTNPTATVNFTNGGLDIDTTSGTGFEATGGATALNVTGPGNSIDTATGIAVNINATTIGGSGITFDSASVNGASNGILITNAGAGAFAANGGSLANVTTRGVDVLGGTGNVTYGGAITTSGVNARSAEVTFRTGGTVLLSGNITDNSLGINVDSNNTGSPVITFSGGNKVINTGGATALTVTNNTTATVNFNGGGLDVDTTSGVGLTATGGGTVNVNGASNTLNTTGGTGILLSGDSLVVGGDLAVSTGTGIGVSMTTGTSVIAGSGLAVSTTSGTGFNATSVGSNISVTGTNHTVTTTTGTGVQISNATIGGGGVTFASVSVNGANNGILITNQGTGAFAASGGSLQNVLARGVDVNGGSGNVTYAGSITTGSATARSVEVTNRNGGALEFSGAITDNGAGVNITANNSGGGTVLFSGGLTLNTNANAAFTAIANIGGVSVAVTGSGNSISTTTGTAVNIANTTIGAFGMTFNSVSVSGAPTGIRLDTTGAGAFTASGGSLANVTTSGVDINAGSGNFTYAGGISTNGGRSVEITGRTGGAIEFSGPITESHQGILITTNNSGGTVLFSGGLTASTGTTPAFQATSNAGGVSVAVTGSSNTITTTTATAIIVSNTTIGGFGMTFNSISANGAGFGIALDNASGGFFTANGGSLANVTTRGVDINAGNGNVTYAGTITTSGASARSVEITGRTGGAIQLSGAITDTSQGISITGNTTAGASVLFSGQLTLNTGTNTAFGATGNSGGITVASTGANSALTTSTATALNVANTTIGASGLTFRSISAGTGAGSSGIGIILDSTGSTAGLTISGNGAAGTGGTIQHKTGADFSTTAGIGILLRNTRNPQLNWMQLNDFDNSAIVGRNVDGFTLSNSVINGTIGTNSAPVEGAVMFGLIQGSTENPAGENGLQGTGLIRNTKISGSVEHNLEFYNNTGTMSLTVDGTGAVGATTADCEIKSNSVPSGSDGIQMEVRGGTQALTVQRCLFDDNKSQAIQVSALGTSQTTVTIDQSKILRTTQGNEGFILANGADAHLTAFVTNNTVSGLGGAAIFVGQVPGNASNLSDLRATITGNNITAPTSATNHSVIAFFSATTGVVAPARVLISGNVVTQNSTTGVARGILVDTPDTGRTPSFHATVLNNSVAIGDNVAGVSGLVVQSRNGSTGCANIGSNTVTFPNGTPGGVLGLRARQATAAVLNIEQSSSPSCTGSSAAVLACRNPASTTEILGTVGTVAQGTCLVP